MKKITLLIICQFIVSYSYAQFSYSKKLSKSFKQKMTVEKPNVCDCGKIDFNVRIIKLKTLQTTALYRLQIINLTNKSDSKIEWVNLHWNQYHRISFSSMTNKRYELAPDGSFRLSEFMFETAPVKPELAHGAESPTSFSIKLDGKECVLKNKRSNYYRNL